MHIITQKRIREAQATWPGEANALDHWYRVMKRAELANFSQMRALFRGADKVGPMYVFNIGGNKLRLIAKVEFQCGRVYIREILTHKEYDTEDWK